MTEHEKNTDFLGRMLLFVHPQEHHRLRADISQVRRKQYCVQRAAQLMLLLALISAAVFGYGVVFDWNFLRKSRLIATVICGLALASPVCLATFLGLLVNYRRELNRLSEECRQLITKVMESRLGRLGTATLTGSESEDGDWHRY